MRPVRLELRGFTSFRDPQVLDFTGLDLFAISGQTGSGKSSLLDAMTYALYGYVERVGRGTGQLVSQGQKRMAVTFDFTVDGTTWRVTRSTPAAAGTTKILLERAEGEGWVQAGEGADRVRDVDARVKELIGLDFDGFTRSVLLPQGRFQEFMVGEARERRRILTDLLGLELFERLNVRAGELERDARLRGTARSEILATEYEGVSSDAIEAAEGRIRAEREREHRLAAAEQVARGLEERWRRERERLEALSESTEELRGIATMANDAAEALVRLGSTLAEAHAGAELARIAAEQAVTAVTEARIARERDEMGSGGLEALVEARERARRLPELRDKISAAAADLVVEAEGTEVRAKARGDLAERLSTVVAEAAQAEMRAIAATARLEEIVLADRAAAVRAELHAGDECPVCGAHIDVLPEAAAPDLAHARADHEAALAGLDRARGEADEANEAVAEAARDEERHADVAARLTSDLQGLRGEEQALEAELAPVFAEALPADPVAALTARVERLNARSQEERMASGRAMEAERERAEADSALDRLNAEVAVAGSSLRALSLDAVLARARRASDDAQLADALKPFPRIGRSEDPEVLSTWANAVAGHAKAALDVVAAVADRAGVGEAGLLAEAAEALRDVDDVLDGPRSIAELVEAVAVARRTSAAAATTARDDAERLAQRLDKRRALEIEVAGVEGRRGRFHDLAQELRSDRIVAFLQAEALRTLAASGSERLSSLSGGRYRLAYEGEQFFVVDTWNGEEMRAARTLSGGETFLASLALALALSDQVQALAVTQRARLESLFLDEGFGTLDPESLELVVEAIEQLGGDGRMIGVISHVQELAIRLPARIEVEKSPRGSRLVRVS